MVARHRGPRFRLVQAFGPLVFALVLLGAGCEAGTGQPGVATGSGGAAGAVASGGTGGTSSAGPVREASPGLRPGIQSNGSIAYVRNK